MYDILFGSRRCHLMHFTQRHGYASFIGTSQGCLGCSASTHLSLSAFPSSSVICWMLQAMSMPTPSWWAASGRRGLPRGKTKFLVGTCSSCATRASSGQGRQHRAQDQETELKPERKGGIAQQRVIRTVNLTALAYWEAPAA